MNEPADDTPFVFVDPGIQGHLTIRTPPLRCMVLYVTWGEAVIQFHEDGRLVVEGCPSMDAAAIAFWRAVVRWTPAGMTVTLPAGYGEES